ncbi:MAG: hypothetical protein K2W96_17525 [Gemmataceae bacterium]|nr:hypothetical protein [Gemmataceae bacterium]
MMRRMLSVAVALFVATGLAFAGEYQGLITSATKDEVKISVRTGKGKKAKSEEKTFPAKGLTIKKGDETVSFEDFAKLVEESKGKTKGVFGKVTTKEEGDDKKEVATEITITPRKKKKES